MMRQLKMEDGICGILLRVAGGEDTQSVCVQVEWMRV